ncbi:hypothetical protein [Pseudomonas shirazensis]
MKFITVTLVDDNQPAIIVKEHIVAFSKIPNQPSNDNSMIRTTGGHNLFVTDTFVELSNKMGFHQIDL